MIFQYFLKVQELRNNKTIKIVDLSVQTVIFLFALVSLLAIPIQGDWVLGVLMAQYLMGLWQMSSSLLSLLFRGVAFEKKKIHFVCSLICLAIIGGITGLLSIDVVSFEEVGWRLWISAIFFFASSWGLALYYYQITWRLLFPRYKKLSNFLPHINF